MLVGFHKRLNHVLDGIGGKIFAAIHQFFYHRHGFHHRGLLFLDALQLVFQNARQPGFLDEFQLFAVQPVEEFIVTLVFHAETNEYPGYAFCCGMRDAHGAKLEKRDGEQQKQVFLPLLLPVGAGGNIAFYLSLQVFYLQFQKLPVSYPVLHEIVGENIGRGKEVDEIE